MDDTYRETPRTDEEKKIILNRLSRIAGQINGIAKMIETDRYCYDILIQLSAIDKAVKSVANVILDAHMRACLVKDIQEGKLESIEEIVNLFKIFQ